VSGNHAEAYLALWAVTLPARLLQCTPGARAGAQSLTRRRPGCAQHPHSLRQQESSSAGAREAELNERLLDLGAFVEVVTAYALDAPAADPEGLRKAEARARLEVASLKQQLEVRVWMGGTAEGQVKGQARGNGLA
jgi:hypothetical protein